MKQMDLTIAGLGVILYSPFAVAHIPRGSDYLTTHFWKPDDVARHVRECQLTTFCTGTPGTFRLEILNREPREQEVQAADFKLRLGLEVRDGVFCIRDLYDLMAWSPECPTSQQFELADGWYRLTVYSSSPASGILGDDQQIGITMEKVSARPLLRHDGVPSLCE